MKQGIRDITYTVAEPKTYLVVSLDYQAELVDFCIKMAERNQIPGLLPLRQQMDDGELTIYYDITGKRRLSDVLQTGFRSEKEMLAVLGKLARTLQELPNYFLRAGQCLLGAQYTYVDNQSNIYLPLVPMPDDPEDSSKMLHDYFTALVGACVSNGKTPSAKMGELLAYVVRPDFHLDAFVQLFEVERAPIQDAKPLEPASKPDPWFQSKHQPPVIEQPKEEPAKGGWTFPKSGKQEEETPAPGGVQIPGQGGVMIPPGAAGGKKEKPAKPEKKKGKEKPAKGEKKPIFGFGGKKNKDEDVDMNKEAHMVIPGQPVQYPPMYTPQPQPVQKPAPAAVGGGKPAGNAHAGGGSWSGTVHLGFDQNTVNLDDAVGGGRTAYLMHNGRQIMLSAPSFTVGRQDCSYVINNPNVSRKHITITQQNGTYAVQDENSSNHTYVNGIALAPYTSCVLDGDCEIRLGNEVLHFYAGGQ